MVVRMRHTSGHTANRRSHHALTEIALIKTETGNFRRSHHMDPVTGMYRGRVVIDMTKKAMKKSSNAGE
jgi:ribosomal protein L32